MKILIIYKADHDCYSIIFSQYIDEDLDYI